MIELYSNLTLHLKEYSIVDPSIFLTFLTSMPLNFTN